MTKHLDTRKNLESQETLDFTNLVDEEFYKKGDVLYVIVDENFVDSWILDFRYSL